VHLRRREPRAVRVAHRLHEVVDEALHERCRELVRRDLASALTENGMADLGDLEDHRSLRG
jgi:hypothetical protein